MATPLRRASRLVLCCLIAAGAGLLTAAERRFFDDDPLIREPESQDSSKVKEWEIDLFIDLATNLFGRPGDSAPNVRAKNINTVDEVPDSSWFTNRLLTRPVTPDDVARGPLTGSGPAPGTWSLVSRKLAGVAPGFTMRDSRNELWFVSFDAARHPEAATSAIIVANKIFWTLGYWQVENYLVSVNPEQILISDKATFTPASGRERRMERAIWTTSSSVRIGARTAATAPSPLVRCPAARSAGSNTTAPALTIRTTSCLTSTAGS